MRICENPVPNSPLTQEMVQRLRVKKNPVRSIWRRRLGPGGASGLRVLPATSQLGFFFPRHMERHVAWKFSRAAVRPVVSSHHPRTAMPQPRQHQYIQGGGGGEHLLLFGAATRQPSARERQAGRRQGHWSCCLDREPGTEPPTGRTEQRG
jgi:hypothetical protein